MTTEPFLRVVRGTPTDDELAALVVVLSSLPAATHRESGPAPSNGWAAYWRTHREDLRPGPGAWRHSLRG